MRRHKLGWIPDLPDNRDFKAENLRLTKDIRLKVAASDSEYLIDEKLFSPVEDQGNLGSCTAQAGMGLIEYMERRAFRKHINGSRLFLYKTTRKLMGLTGDTGAYLRDTIKAMRLFGVPPEDYYSYDISKFDQEPNAFVYSLANNYKSLKYARVDQPTPQGTLVHIKDLIMNKYPMMFGFTCFESLYDDQEGMIPFPGPNESVIGGHAVVLTGYSDTKQAFRIRNSWGTGWGQGGYGWLPYEYLMQGLMDDIWVVTKQDWIDTGVFD